MDQLIQQLIDQAGLTPEQAQKSIQVIKDFITSQLPPMMQGMVDNFLGARQNDDKVGE